MIDDRLGVSMEAAAKEMEAAVKGMQALGETILDMAREFYRERGAPHGDTEEGLRRWIDEHPCWLDQIAAGVL